MKRSFFPFFLQTIRIHYQDPELALYTKGVLGLLWLVQLPVALWYGAPAQFYALLGAMLLAIGVDLVPFPRQHSRADDYVTSAVMLVCCFVLFWKASIGYFSVFFLLIYLFCNVFILGIAGSAPFSLLGLTGVMLCLRGVLVADPAARYGADFVPRLPFLFLCILGIAYIITFFIQRYWVEKLQQHVILQARIDAERARLSEMSLKVITAMYSALSSKVPEVDLHCEQVAALTQELARRMGLDETACRDGYYAGLLHEVGAVGLPDAVLQNRQLTEEQFQLYQTYVERGYAIILQLQIVDRVAETVRFHREWYDGTGYCTGLRGEEIPEVEEQVEEKADFAAIGDEDITFAFDTVFIVRKTTDRPLDGLRGYLSSIGDSLVIGEDDESFKVHVHTDTPGDALNEAQKYGTLELAKIENMRTQAADLAAGRKAQSTDDLDAIEEELENGVCSVAAPEKRYGFLAVCAGDGLAAVFRDLGVDRIVSGGQTMNPSTEAILREIDQTPSEVVFVLPNNKNIVMAAQQCVGLSEKEVIVVPTATVPQGISAMMSVDPEEPDAQNVLRAMTDAASNVTTAQITYAARNSDFDGFAINEGDYLALCDGKLLGTDRSLDVLLERLAHLAADKSAEFITVYAGEGVSDEDAARAAALFEAVCPDAEVSALSGGQPVYYYIVAIE